ncbi:MAG: coenzyme F420-0:L-glutamate ligase / coenzyme F420:gamma-L-glutamate ligase [Nocardioidaceae bacterium]|jgi:coenzyme F420-0:L-glutamate ligase/coenzyme F420-1:gamma-L-glutamate ligase|nr:coenzyme F420-0:L-glutamate ligase / coenzyme F420:gamma-L-glutamate ligase [Nocardioidaceae bacterium]
MALHAWPLEGIGEIKTGDDLAGIIAEHLAEPLADADVLVVTSKVVSKAAGLATSGDRELLLDAETDRVVARRGQTRIVRTHSGLTLAAAGVDASNLVAGTVIPLPPDPDGAARDLRARLEQLTGVRLGVIVSDTAGRAWRIGQTDIAIGVSGIAPLLSFAGVEDAYGNVLAVTAPAIADELASVADLVAGKLDGHPVVVVRGLPTEWFGPHDEGAASLIRDEDGDLFGLGAREAVLAAVSRGHLPRGFPVAEPDDDLIALARAGADLTLADVTVAADGSLEVRALSEDGAPEAYVEAGALAERLRILARALRREVVIAVVSD